MGRVSWIKLVAGFDDDPWSLWWDVREVKIRESNVTTEVEEDRWYEDKGRRERLTSKWYVAGFENGVWSYESWVKECMWPQETGRSKKIR